MPWNFGTATQPGRSSGEPKLCQDVAMARIAVDSAGQPRCLVLAVADGAGSAEHGLAGAAVAATTFCNHAVEQAESGRVVNRDLVVEATLRAREAVMSEAEKLELPAAHFASTLVGALCLPSETFYVLVGDGAAVCSLNGRLMTAIWPDESEYLNTPNFVTHDDLGAILKVRRLSGRADHVFLMSDGLQYIVVESKTERPQSNFFQLAFQELSSTEIGESEFANRWLTALLQSQHIVTRTNDDTAVAYGHFWENKIHE